MHRGAEKLFEVRDYRQITVLANRHDWLSAFGSELGVVLAVERMLGMEVPARAVWLRTLLAELNRVVNHLCSCPARVGRHRFPAPRGAAAGGAGGGQRRPDPLHGQPGRRPQGGRAGRLDRPGPRAPSTAVRLPTCRPRPELVRAGHAGCCAWPTRRRTASAGRSPAPPGWTSTCAGTSPTWRTGSCGAGW